MDMLIEISVHANSFTKGLECFRKPNVIINNNKLKNNKLE